METGTMIGNLDIAQISIYAFWVFFALLIWYLRQEDRREGYPLESDVSGEYSKDPWLFLPRPKSFHLPHDRGVVKVPDLSRDTREIAAKRMYAYPGAPLIPTGDPLLDGVGPGAWAERSDYPDLTSDGKPRIVPMRVEPDFYVVEDDLDPRGLPVAGADGAIGGKVKDIWVDRSEQLIRYLEVETQGEGGAVGRSVLLPMTFCVLRRARNRNHFYVDAVLGAHFAKAPGLANPDQVTRLEEEKIVGFYGAGTLYATPRRQEAML